MSREWLRQAFMNPWPALLNAGLIAGQAVRTRDVRRAAVFAAQGLGLPTLADAYAFNLALCPLVLAHTLTARGRGSNRRSSCLSLGI